MLEQNDSDRRVFPRLTVIGARLAVSSSAGDTFYAFARDVSQGGVYVLAERSPGVGAQVEVRLVMNGHVSRVSARGIVLRDDTRSAISRQGVPGFAVRFLDPDATGTALLQELIGSVLAAQPQQETMIAAGAC